ncbi:DUF3892 domain-containing protein [Nannocystaceae bacterium ST9]
MATKLIVTCSTKDGSRNITGIGGSGWRHAAALAITNIRANTHEYRLLRADGPLVRPYGTQHLTSEADAITGNNLASIPDC